MKGAAKRCSNGLNVVSGVVVAAAALAVVVGCDGGRLPEADPGTGNALIACGAGATITEVEIPRDGAEAVQPYRITAGPDGNLWVTEVWANSIARLTVDGRRDVFPLPDERKVQGIAAGPDGNVWFAVAGDRDGAIGRITPDGQITEFPLSDTPAQGNRWPSAVISGPDGNIWFTDPTGNAIGSIGVDGVVRFDGFLPGTQDWRDTPGSIAIGSDGNFWFGEVNRFGRMTPTGQVTFFSLTGTGEAAGSGLPLISGPDGTLWSAGPVSGPLRRVALPATDDAELRIDEFVPPGYDPATAAGFGGLAVGPDGNIWYTHESSVGCVTPAGKFHDLPLPSSRSAFALTLGPDGALWFTEPQYDRVGRISVK